MDLPKNSPFKAKLEAYRKEAARRRAEAFCDGPDYVLGIAVNALTPATFSLLVAHGSAIVCGGQIQEGDVRNYLWFHSRHYLHKGHAEWPAAKRKALDPLMRVLLNRRFRFSLERKPSQETYAATMALAIADIKNAVSDAFADCPPSMGGSSQPVATLEAEMIAIFARELQWQPDRTRNTPLRQLFQLLRCIRAWNGTEPRDAQEDAILAEHITLRNAELKQRMEAMKHE